MNVDIYIRERSGGREIRIPWLPEQIKYKSGGVTMATYDIMNRGEVAVPTGSGLAAVSWSSEFPGKNRTDKSMMRGQWKAPSTYHNILEDWKKTGAPLSVLVTGYPINLDVILDDYEGAASGGFGDWGYNISLIEDRDITVGTMKNDSASDSDNNKRSTPETTSYTIKKGDTLWSIAEKLLGSGAKWKTIYDANKEIIESTATKRWTAAGIDRDSQNGHWIFEGTVLRVDA